VKISPELLGLAVVLGLALAAATFVLCVLAIANRHA
jgi:hypothetical protein